MTILLAPDEAPGRVLPTATVVICCYTLDRWDDVVAALASLERQTHPSRVVVVVDHNDDLLARMRIRAAQSTLPVTVLPSTGARGLSGARNTGVAATDSEIVVFLDDDARAADAAWLTRMLSRYLDPDVWGVGGEARPDWGDAGAPKWFPAEFGWVVGCSYRGQPTSALPVRNLLGCNMSFRRRAFDKIGNFTEGIGRVGTNPVGCEETEFCIRLRAALPAALIVYDPAIVVDHRVSPDRRRFSYFRARCRAEGRSKALVSRNVGTADGLSSERRYATVVLPMGVARGLAGAGTGDFNGLRRAGAIVVGLVSTVAGYRKGSLAAGQVGG